MSSRPTYADVGLVLAAAGSATRFGVGRNKVLEDLAGRPVFMHVLQRFAQFLSPASCVVVSDVPGIPRFSRILAATPWGGSIRLVAGGSSRAESILNGLAALPESARLVAVQDAARPLSSTDLLRRCVASAREHGSGVAAMPVTDTIKIADTRGRVISTPDRRTMWAAETPQVFGREALMKAYRDALANGVRPTDDAGAIELAGQPVFLVNSLAPNPKITYPADLLALRAMASM